MVTRQASLSCDKLRVGYGGRDILKSVALQIPKGEITVLIGANACGKSTLLKTLSRLLKPQSGSVLVDGKAIREYGTKDLAKILGILPQTPLAPEGIRVADLVARGRFPYQKRFSGLDGDDYAAIKRAMEMMNITDLADKDLSELSGGQRQRVWIAMALTQETDILLLDEPTTYLDIAHQIDILDLLKTLNHQRKTTIVMVLHDINLAVRYADYLVAVKAGEIVAIGRPQALITPDLMSSVFDLACHVMVDPVSKTPMIIPIGKHHHLYNKAL